MSGPIVRLRGGYQPVEGATLRVVGLGLGVQSSCLVEMFAREEIGPMPDFAFFSETHAESNATYENLRALTTGNRKLPFPVRTISRGDLGADVLASAASWRDLGPAGRADRAQWPRALRVANPPLFTRGPRLKARRVIVEALPMLGLEAEEVELTEEFARGGESFGFLNRSCTRDYKIDTANAELRRLLGTPPRKPVPASVRVEYMLGISTDEMHRIGGASPDWIVLTYPLIQERMSRVDCYGRFRRWEIPIPPESGCYFCPFRDDVQWLALKREEPETFRRACAFDEAIREGIRGTLHRLYLHSSRTPLHEVDFTKAHGGWADEGFRNECAGRCGV